MNYGYLFSMELQKMAREFQFTPRGDDTGMQQAQKNYDAQILQSVLSGSNTSGKYYGKRPGGPRVFGGAGKSVKESQENAAKARSDFERKNAEVAQRP